MISPGRLGDSRLAAAASVACATTLTATASAQQQQESFEETSVTGRSTHPPGRPAASRCLEHAGDPRESACDARLGRSRHFADRGRKRRQQLAVRDQERLCRKEKEYMHLAKAKGEPTARFFRDNLNGRKDNDSSV